jgi:hypothetical protein
MKKLVFTMLMMAGILQAKAYDYPYLVFQNSEGTATFLAVESLSITINDGKLVATNADGSQTFSLSDLSKMFFSKTTEITGINDINTNGSQEVEVFTTGGVKLGKFESITSAKTSLKPGIYVIKNSQKTYRIAVK